MIRQAVPLAVSFAMFFMDITRTLHPPGGATALIAVMGSAKVKALGWMYILVPVASSSCILVAIAVLLNNLLDDRHYPISYFGLNTTATAAPTSAASAGTSDGNEAHNEASPTAQASLPVARMEEAAGTRAAETRIETGVVSTAV